MVNENEIDEADRREEGKKLLKETKRRPGTKIENFDDIFLLVEMSSVHPSTVFRRSQFRLCFVVFLDAAKNLVKSWNMSYNSPFMGVFNRKAMYQSFVFVMSNLCIVASLVSADTTLPLMSATEMALSITVNGVVAGGDHDEWIEYNSEHNYRDYRPSSTVRPITPKRPANWDPYVADSCGGTVNIPLSFDRLSSFKSSGFPATRDYPLICKWNVKVNYRKCRRTRITIRLDGRSRLADVANCTRGHFTVSPFMKQSRVCGRIGNIAPFHWYFDSQQPEKDVTITMKNMAINDGYSEGVSFTLQGECLPEKTNIRKMNVGKENDRFHARWMTRLLEDFQTGEGPRVIKVASQTTRRPSTTVRPSTTGRPSTTARPNTDKHRTITTRTPSSTTERSISYVNPDILWPFLRSPEPAFSLQSLLDSQLLLASIVSDNDTLTVKSSTLPSINRFESTNPLAPAISNLSLNASNSSDLLYPTNQSIHLNVSSSSQSHSEMNSTFPSLILDGQSNMSNPISYISLNGQIFIFSKFHKFSKLLP